MVQDRELHQLAMCTGECLTKRSRVGQRPPCFVALEYMYSVIAVRKEKGGRSRKTFSSSQEGKTESTLSVGKRARAYH
jgi:hypothetical protein